MFDMFSSRAQRVIVYAQEEAARFNHKHMGPEHVILGILGADEGAAARALSASGIDYETAMNAVLAIIPSRGGRASEHVPFSTETRKALERAAREARKTRESELEPEQLLLGLLHKERGSAAKLLRSLGVPVESVRGQVRTMMAQPANESGGRPLGKRIDYYDDPEAPAANSLVPSVNVFVVNDRDEVLMIRRTDNDNWAVPGGALDLGESVPQAAVRETLEETGITCAITGLVGIYSDPKHIIYYTSDGEARQEFSIAFTARPVSGEPTPSDESKEVLWVSREKLAGYHMDRSMRMRVDHFLAGGPTHIG